VSKNMPKKGHKNWKNKNKKCLNYLSLDLQLNH
jgi:hypothetical protein